MACADDARISKPNAIAIPLFRYDIDDSPMVSPPSKIKTSLG